MISDKHSAVRSPQTAVVIVGAGPAGSSLAIRLAKRGFPVTLIEKDRFPREKLCGEFISPECFRHFDDLGVRSELFSKGGDRVYETRFFNKRGRSVAVPTSWFGHGEFALSLSRAEMDLALMDRARSLGVEVIEGSRVAAAEVIDGRIRSVSIRNEAGERNELDGDVFVDASGRSAILAKLVGSGPAKAHPGGFVGFKAHLSRVEPQPGVCEIYFFDGGYGGLGHVESGKANFCFLVKAKLAKQFIGQTNDLFSFILGQNQRAKQRMAGASALHDWIGVSVDKFGLRSDVGARNLAAVGDAGAFIDPFTGSGMLMALESAELLVPFVSGGNVDRSRYQNAHADLFRRRLLVSSVLRRAAFIPKAASVAISLASISERFRLSLARGTRIRTESTENRL